MRRLVASLIALLPAIVPQTSAQAQTLRDHLLVNRNSGMCVEIPGANPDPGVWAAQYPCRDLPRQQWSFVPGRRRVQDRERRDRRLPRDHRRSAEDGRSVNQAVCDGTAKQAFKAQPTGDWIQIVTSSGLCLDLMVASIDDGGLLIQRVCSEASSQKWTLSAPALPSVWSAKIDLPIIPVAASTLRNGKILAWSAYDRFAYGGDRGKTFTTIYDPATGIATEKLVSSTGHDMFCPGTTTLPDGRILVNGGSSSAKTSIYDPVTNTWTTGAEMNVPRGYQGNTLLSTGGVLTIGGSWSGGEGGKIGEVWSKAGGWRRLPKISAEALSGDDDPGGIYRSDNHMWLFASRDGFAFHAGPGAEMHWIRTRGDGLVRSAGRRSDDAYSMNGNVVMVDAGKLLKLGGAPAYEKAQANDAAYTIDFSQGPDARVRTLRQRSMAFARAFVNSVALPSGDVVVIGGQNYAELFSDYRAVYIPELWQAKTGAFARLAPMTIPRTYHSIATLMLDGRVFVGGGGLCGTCDTNHPDAQILTPPYLLNADGTPAVRPEIVAAPTTVSLGDPVEVTTDRKVASFAIVRLSAVTHSVNNDQRRIAIPIGASARNSYVLKFPTDRGTLLAGDWMLFAMTKAGVPSVAKIVRVK